MADVMARRTFRCSDALWNTAHDKAVAEGRVLSDVLREMLDDYVAIDPNETVRPQQ